MLKHSKMIGAVLGAVAIILVFFNGSYGQDPKVKPENTRRVSLEEVLRTFRFPKDTKKTALDLSAELLTAIKNRGVGFLLDDQNRKELSEAGASDELITAIDNAFIPVEKRFMKKDLSATELREAKLRQRNMIELWNEILHLFPINTFEGRRKLIEAMKLFLARFGDDPGDDTKELIDWIRVILPKLEAKVEMTY